MTSNTETCNWTSSYGRVVRLHFACKAALPIGSTLRVTSSHLWAPGTLTPNDPTDAKAVSSRAADVALPDNTTDGEVGPDGVASGCEHHYTSSVEMVTSPEEWPVWRTRTPVVVVLRHHHGRVEHHRYRYMVVTPGAHLVRNDSDSVVSQAMGRESTSESSLKQMQMGVDQDPEEKSQVGELEYVENESQAHPILEVIDGKNGMGASTSQEGALDGSTVGSEVMAWEDPFKDREAESQSELRHVMSAASLPSVRRIAVSKNLANLPYRTVDIDTSTAEVVDKIKCSVKDKDNSAQEDDITMKETSTTEDIEESAFTHDGIRIDSWNNPEDYSFRPFVIRDAINKQNRSKKLFLSRLNSDTTMCDSDGGGMTPLGTSVGSMGIARDDSVKLGTRVSFSNLVECADNIPSNPSSMAVTPKISSRDPNKKKQRIFFVCYHLPVILTKEPFTSAWTACWAESLLAKTEDSSIARINEAHWVGTVSSANHPINTDEDRDAVRAVLAEMNCTPLFLKEDVQEAHYLGMCKQVLWPAFHNIDLLDLSSSGWIPPGNNGTSGSRATYNTNWNGGGGIPGASGSYATSIMESDWDQSRLDGWWEAYVQVNSAFADILSSMLKPGDIMWVHDYHLSLLPKILDEKEHFTYSGRSVTKKVFFLHIPFPTSQIFRELECGEAILEGMLHADVVGFHAFDHARHFLNAAKRILGLNYESLVGGLIGVQYRRKTVLVSMHNVSVEPKMVDAALALPSVVDGSALLRHKHSSRTIIAGVDIAQRLSGISLKLLAFERLLTDYPVWQQKVIMVQKCLIPGSRRADEINTIREVRYLVRRIQDKFGKHVIDVEEVIGSSLPIDQRLALWSAADVFMVTPVREGLNLLPMEYIFTRKAPAPAGVVISSEFSAVCSILNGALRVNPFDIQMTVTSIDKALTMDVQEKEGRRCRDTAFVTESPSPEWTNNVLRDLNDATAVMNGGYDGNDSDDTTIMGTKYDKKDLITSTAAFLSHENDLAFAHLDKNAVVEAYNVTKRRVIILDLNGTIVIKEPPGKYLKRDILGTSGHKPPQSVCKALTSLCADPNNIVFVVSGDSQENVENAIGNIPGVGLAASNGACFSPPLSSGETIRKWKYFDLGVDWDAVKRIVLPVLSKYTARSNGSFVKLTHSSIGWSYYSCDPEWGSLQASHLVLELESALRPFDVRFVMIKGIVEIVPRRLNKGLIVKKVLREVASANGGAGVDFVLCMGDDIHDEKMFTSVFSFIAELEDEDHAKPSPSVIDSNDQAVSSYIKNSNVLEPMEDEVKCKNVSNQMYAFTAAVGKKASHASSYVEDAREVASLLIELTGESSNWKMRATSFDAIETGTDLFR